MRLTFFGSDAFSVRCLQGLMQRHPNWQWHWITSWPKGPFEQFCLSQWGETTQNSVANYRDFGIVASYGHLIDPVTIRQYKYLLNAHPSLLPRWRGSSPIQRAIMNGDPETGVSIMSVAETFDTGPIWRQERVALTGNEFCLPLTVQLADLSAALLSEVIEQIPAGLRPTAQSTAGKTKASKITRADAEIRFKEHSAAQIYAIFRAISHQETLWFQWGDRIVQMLEVEPVSIFHGQRCQGKYLYIPCAQATWIRCSQFRVQGKSHVFNGPTVWSMMK